MTRPVPRTVTTILQVTARVRLDMRGSLAWSGVAGVAQNG